MVLSADINPFLYYLKGEGCDVRARSLLQFLQIAAAGLRLSVTDVAPPLGCWQVVGGEGQVLDY